MRSPKPAQEVGYRILNKDAVVANGKRSNASVIQNLAHLGFGELSTQVKGCASWLRYELLDTMDEKGVPNANLVDANFCRVRGCRVCDRRRQQKWRARLHAAAESIAWPEKWVGFTTLTMRNPAPDDLPAALDRLGRGWVNLKKQDWWKSTINGSVKTMEITWGQDGRPHPHLHLLQWQHPNATGSRRVSTDAVKAHWRSAIGADYDPIVHRTRIYSQEPGSGAAIREAVKYVSKSGYQLTSFDRFACIWPALRGRKTITTTGIVKSTLALQKSCREDDLLQISTQREDRGNPLGVSIEFRWDPVWDGYTISSVR